MFMFFNVYVFLMFMFLFLIVSEPNNSAANRRRGLRA
jgi:hypothetical protein